MIRSVFIALALIVAGPATAQATRTFAPGAKSPPATLAEIGWIAGRWAGPQEGGAFASETYSPPSGGQIAGHFFETRDGRVALMEMLQIVERDGSLVYRLRHFRRDFTGWEDATGKPREFPLVAVDRDHAWFDGLTLDRSRPGVFAITVRIVGKEGTSRELTYRYPRP